MTLRNPLQGGFFVALALDSGWILKVSKTKNSVFSLFLRAKRVSLAE